MTRSKIELLQAMLKGEKIESTPFAMWKHFPIDDLHAERLAAKQLNYLDKFDSIFMKVSPNGRYCVTDWGCEIAFDENRLSGSAFCTKYRVNTIDDWSSLEELDVQEGMFGEQLKAIKLINEGMKNDTPFIETIFNPLMVAAKLAENQQMMIQAIKENPKGLHEGLKVITKVMTEFAKISVEYGASGVFLATQEASYDVLTIEQYKEFSMKYDLELLKAIEKKAPFNVMHVHGDNIMFDLIAQNYPIQAINWHDQLAAPTIADASKKFNGLLVGGIEEKEFLFKASLEEITSRIQKEIDSVDNSKLIIAPGCVIPINITNDKIQAIVDYLQKK
ncbi:MAG: uroporphyrinogen decarboxylase family protein [Candidatus Heimdallarchaeota archaeon]